MTESEVTKEIKGKKQILQPKNDAVFQALLQEEKKV